MSEPRGQPTEWNLGMAVNTTVQVTLPAMGESVREGTVLEWHKQEGDAVEADETLVEVSTDKVDAEVPAPASGTLVKIHAAEGETVAVGSVLRLRVIDCASPSPSPGSAGSGPSSAPTSSCAGHAAIVPAGRTKRPASPERGGCAGSACHQLEHRDETRLGEVGASSACRA
jgi:2-oxoglutarate dehydrogenase E1 component